MDFPPEQKLWLDLIILGGIAALYRSLPYCRAQIHLFLTAPHIFGSVYLHCAQGDVILCVVLNKMPQ
jgi:hypothetical protein